MAQMTESLAQAIINGAGVTRNELEQLARCWISNHLSAQANVRVTDEAVKSAFDRYWDVYWTVSPPKDREMQRNKDGSMSTKSVPPNLAPIRAALEDFAARLSQGTQGEAVGQIDATGLELLADGTDATIQPAHPAMKGHTQLYTRPAERAAVPDGWVPVPREPYIEQLEAIMSSYWGDGWDNVGDMREARLVDAQNMYDAMLTAAPQPPEGARVVDGLTAQTFGEWCNTLTHVCMYITEREPGNAQYGIEKVLNELRAWQRKLAAPTLAGKEGAEWR